MRGPTSISSAPQPGFSTRLGDLARLSLVDLVRRNPGNAATVNVHYGELSQLFDGEGYDRLAPEDRDKTLRVLAEKPFLGGALESKGAGRVHDVMEQLIEKPGKPETRTRLVRILDKLDPDNSAKFISNLSHGIGKELSKEKIFDAIAKGFSLSGNVAGADVGISGASGVSVAAPDFSAGGVPVRNRKLGFDPNPLREALDRQKDKDYRDLLTDVLDGFTKNHELMSSPERWSDRQKREYFDAIRRLPGGQGASDLTAPVGRPAFRSGPTTTPGANPP